MGIEQRQYPRALVKVEVAMYDIVDHRFAYGTMTDISAGGMGVATWETFELHTPLSLNFELAPKYVFTKVPADVVIMRSHTEFEGRNFYGLQFHHLDPLLKPTLETFVNYVMGKLVQGQIKGNL